VPQKDLELGTQRDPLITPIDGEHRKS